MSADLSQSGDAAVAIDPAPSVDLQADPALVDGDPTKVADAVALALDATDEARDSVAALAELGTVASATVAGGAVVLDFGPDSAGTRIQVQPDGVVQLDGEEVDPGSPTVRAALADPTLYDDPEAVREAVDCEFQRRLAALRGLRDAVSEALRDAPDGPAREAAAASFLRGA